MSKKFNNIQEEYDFAQACANHTVNKLMQDNDFKKLSKDSFSDKDKEIVSSFAKEIIKLSNPGFACAIDSFKNELTLKLSDKKDLEHVKRQEIALIICEQLNDSTQDSQQKRDIVIKVITDFHMLKSSINENEYYKIAQQEKKKLTP